MWKSNKLENSLQFVAIYEKIGKTPALKVAGTALATYTLASSGLAAEANGLTDNYY